MLTCPYCNYKFSVLMANAQDIPAYAPAICESCAEVSLIDHGFIRKMSPAEMAAVMTSPAWENVIAPAMDLIQKLRRATAAAAMN